EAGEDAGVLPVFAEAVAVKGNVETVYLEDAVAVVVHHGVAAGRKTDVGPMRTRDDARPGGTGIPAEEIDRPESSVGLLPSRGAALVVEEQVAGGFGNGQVGETFPGFRPAQSPANFF